MNTDWQRTDELLAQALEIPEPQRLGFLDRECGDDLALRQEVADLLAVDDAALAYVDQPIFELLSPAENRSAKTLGPYQIDEELGRGGTAVVYRAHRTDGTDTRPVAIKVLEPSFAREASLQRIQREGAILGKLRHPNIARVFGGGMDHDGRPYMVMELIEGEPIDRYCAQQRLTIHQRVRLLLPLLSAIRYAHANLVVHRDLKPDNILVAANGTVKVLDFGISKLLDPTSKSPGTLTAFGMQMLTPEYAAPEQLSMAPMISTAVDVYTLGVLLYELLTDQRPFERASDPSGFIRRVLTEDAAPPSHHFRPAASHTAKLEESTSARRASAKKIAGLLKSDLDPILTKALSKQAEQRYRSVDEFEQDLINFLEHRPVTAKRGHLTYRFRKMLRRYQRSLAVAAVLVAAMAGWIADRESSRQNILAERNKALAVQAYVTDLFTNFDPYNRDPRKAATIEVLIENSLDKASLEMVPEFKAMLLKTLGLIYGNQGNYDKSIALTGDALDLLRQALPPTDVRIAKSETALADRLLFSGDVDAGTALLEQAVESLKIVDPPDAYSQAATTTSLARAYSKQGKLPLGIETAERAQAMVQDLAIEPKVRSLGFEITLLLGEIHRSAGNLQQSEAYLSAVYAGCQETFGEMDARSLNVLSAVAMVIFDQGRHDEGIEVLQLVVERIRKVQGQHRDLGRAQLQLAESLAMAGRVAEARQAASQALSVLLATVGPENQLTRRCRIQLESLDSVP